MLIAIILTKNEELHIERALRSLTGLADRCIVVDSGSNDKTLELAEELGAEILHHEWTNYSDQFNWALDQVTEEFSWILRLDADEFVSDQLREEILSLDLSEELSVKGYRVNRYMRFLSKDIKRGGIFPIRVVRLFQKGSGVCENRWMDEHILVSGNIKDLKGHITDDNFKTISWWTDKHNWYASREAVDILNLKYKFMPHESIALDYNNYTQSSRSEIKRLIKEKLYVHLPLGVRAFFYFFYRYIIRLGIIDSTEARSFHVLQGFWYRYLVDLKVNEVESYMNAHECGPQVAIKNVLSINIK